MKYTTQYGNRRLVACEKLGWKKIPAYVDGELTEVNISDIEQNFNARTKLEGISELMQSIKDNGLLQPIGLVSNANAKGKSAEMLLVNAVENVQRIDLTPTELGKVCDELYNKHNMTLAEMSARLGLPKARIKTAWNLFNKAPAKIQERLGYGRTKGRRISPSVVEQIINRSPSKETTEEMFEAIETGKLKPADISTATTLIRGGMGVRQAAAQVSKFKTTMVNLTFDIAELNKLKTKYDLSQNELVLQMLQGKIPVVPKLFFAAE